MVSIYDTALQEVVPLDLRDAGKVSMYVCGPTVYAPPHLGHGRMTLTYDIFRRFLIWAGYDVTFVSNVTDIDDQIINRANDEGRDWADIAVKCEAIWFRAMDALNVMRPDHTPHATEYVDQMVDLIEQLVAADKAYVTSDGVYLSVDSVEGYGLLAHQSLEDLREGGGDRELVGTEKRHPADFALWKFAKPDEPHWPAPWGDGRPGWHTECVVMSLDLLGEGFDLHTGGLDLTFPHHENERAQAVALGRSFSRHWMHNGFIELEGEKMSKSLGNVKNLLDLVDEYDARAYRMLILQSHYRSPMEVTDTTLRQAEAAVGRLDAFARRTAGLDGTADDTVLAAFRSAMENDLDTAKAVDLLFRQVREANTALDGGDPGSAAIAAATARAITEVLGLVLKGDAAAVPDEIAGLARERQDARAARDFERADAIRDQLTEAGWMVEDSADGPIVRPLNG